MKGKVKFYNVSKHFGFIQGDDGKDYFVHSSGLAPGAKLFENDEVNFDAEEGDRGLKAVNVTKVGGDNAQAESAPAEEAEEEKEEKEETLEDAAEPDTKEE